MEGVIKNPRECEVCFVVTIELILVFATDGISYSSSMFHCFEVFRFLGREDVSLCNER